MKKVAVVTGAAQGIGRAITRRLLRGGYSVAAGDVDAEAGENLLETYAGLGELAFVQADVSQEEDTTRLIGAATERFGHLDALVSNAGISRNQPLTELSLDDWNEVIGTNLTAAFLCAKHAAPQLTRQGGAAVLIASSRALMSEADTEAYSASKGGLVALAHALAISLGPEVRVNAVSPGWIEVGDWQKDPKTPQHSEADKKQHPVGRVGRPEDVADLVHFLLSDRSGFITGQNFVIDGGMTKKMMYVD